MDSTWSEAFGYEKVESFMSSEQIDDVQQHINYLVSEEDKKDYVWKYFEKDKKTLSRIEYFVNHNKSLRGLSLDAKLLSLVQEKLRDIPVLFKDKINFKYPGGEGFLPHQDIAASWGNYCNRHVSVAIPLCDTNEENGCIFFGKKTNHMLTENFQDLNENIHLEACPTNAGDIILFDSYVPHASYGNNSNLSRTIVFFTYTPSECGNFYEEYHSDKFKNVPPDIYKIEGQKYRSGNSNSLEVKY